MPAKTPPVRGPMVAEGGRSGASQPRGRRSGGFAGFLGIGDQYNNFGFFKLTNQNFNYNGWKFVLAVMFTAPPGVSTTNIAKLQGEVHTTTGGVTVHFDTNPINLTAIDGTNFTLQLNELDVTRGTVNNPGVGYVNGSLTVTPEPATVEGKLALFEVLSRINGRSISGIKEWLSGRTHPSDLVPLGRSHLPDFHRLFALHNALLGLLLDLLGLARDELGKGVADAGLGGNLGGRNCRRHGRDLELGGRRDSREHGVVDHPLGQLLV